MKIFQLLKRRKPKMDNCEKGALVIEDETQATVSETPDVAETLRQILDKLAGIEKRQTAIEAEQNEMRQQLPRRIRHIERPERAEPKTRTITLDAETSAAYQRMMHGGGRVSAAKLEHEAAWKKKQDEAENERLNQINRELFRKMCAG